MGKKYLSKQDINEDTWNLRRLNFDNPRKTLGACKVEAWIEFGNYTLTIWTSWYYYLFEEFKFDNNHNFKSRAVKSFAYSQLGPSERSQILSMIHPRKMGKRFHSATQFYSSLIGSVYRCGRHDEGIKKLAEKGLIPIPRKFTKETVESLQKRFQRYFLEVASEIGDQCFPHWMEENRHLFELSDAGII